MKRRHFLSHAAATAVAAPFFLNGMPLRAAGHPSPAAALLSSVSETDRVLVLVQLSGGNDGLNTVIPLDQYARYASARANIAIPERSVLALDGGAGFHPALAEVRTLQQSGTLVIVQSVCYPNPNQSHFRATDIWMSGSDYNEYLTSGWIGRYLDEEFPGYPSGFPNAAMPDPLAIQIGAVISLTLQGPAELMGIAIQDPQTFYDLVNGVPGGGTDDPPNTPAGRELTYIRKVQAESQAYSTVIKTAADRAQNRATYPTPDANDRFPLSEQLKIVARLIAGGLKTRVYIVNIGGFDTHDNQVDASDTSSGQHAVLLRRMSQAIAAFQRDLELLGIADRVVGMTFSEFGRRVSSNNGRGTDHGTAAPMFVFGSMVLGGIRGTTPDLTNLDNGNLRMQFDYRQIYASLLHQWFGVAGGALQAVLGRTWEEVPLIRGTTSAGELQSPAGFALHQNTPNPFTQSTTITFDLPAECETQLAVYDVRGRQVAVLLEGRRSSGTHAIPFSAAALPPGAYLVRLRAGTLQAARLMTRVR